MAILESRGQNKPPEKIQLKSMNDQLRAAIYEHLRGLFQDHWHGKDAAAGPGYQAGRMVWIDLLHKHVDNFSESPEDFRVTLKNYIAKAAWNEVYALVEFLYAHTSIPLDPVSINRILEKEKAGYRLVGKIISPISGSF
jgi:hypothetical protein